MNIYNCLGVDRNTGKYIAGNISRNCASILLPQANVELLKLVCVYCTPHMQLMLIGIISHSVAGAGSQKMA